MDLSRKLLQRLKIRQLNLLVAIDECSSLRGAAEAIGVSQPTVTKIIKELEADLALPLFDRTNRGVVPTEYGIALIRHARLIQAQLRHAGDELDDLSSGAGGRVVIGTLLAASESIIPKAIAKLRQSRPKVMAKIVTGTNDVLIPALVQGDLDLVVGRLPEFRHRAGIQQEVLYSDDIVCIVRSGHPLLAQQQLTPEQLCSWEWILPPPETTLRRQIEKAFADSGTQAPFCAVESIALQTNRELLKTSDMIGVGSPAFFFEDIAQGNLVTLPVTLDITSGTVGVSTRAGHPLPPTAKAFLEELRQEAEILRSKLR